MPMMRMNVKVIFTEDFREWELQYFFGDQPYFKAPGPPFSFGTQIATDTDGTGREWHRKTFTYPKDRDVPGIDAHSKRALTRIACS